MASFDEIEILSSDVESPVLSQESQPPLGQLNSSPSRHQVQRKEKAAERREKCKKRLITFASLVTEKLERLDQRDYDLTDPKQDDKALKAMECTDRLKKRYQKCLKELRKIQNLPELAEDHEASYVFSATPYPAINRAVTDYVNKKNKGGQLGSYFLPNISELKATLTSVNVDQNLRLSDDDLNTLARKVANAVTRWFKVRRYHKFLESQSDLMTLASTWKKADSSNEELLSAATTEKPGPSNGANGLDPLGGEEVWHLNESQMDLDELDRMVSQLVSQCGGDIESEEEPAGGEVIDLDDILGKNDSDDDGDEEDSESEITDEENEKPTDENLPQSKEQQSADEDDEIESMSSTDAEENAGVNGLAAAGTSPNVIEEITLSSDDEN